MFSTLNLLVVDVQSWSAESSRFQFFPKVKTVFKTEEHRNLCWQEWKCSPQLCFFSQVALFFFSVWTLLILITCVLTGSPIRPGGSLYSCYYLSALDHVRLIPCTFIPLSTSGESSESFWMLQCYFWCDWMGNRIQTFVCTAVEGLDASNSGEDFQLHLL